MQKVERSKVGGECPSYDSRRIDRFSWKGLFAKASSYLWRGFKYRTIRVLGFATRFQGDVVKGYCRIWEVEHRISSAYRKVLKDVRPEIRPKVEEVYKKLKSRIAVARRECPVTFFKKAPNLEFHALVNRLEKEFESEDVLVQQIAQEVMIFYRDRVQSDLNQYKKKIGSIHLQLKEEVDLSNGLPTWEEMIKVVRFDSWACQRLQKIHGIEKYLKKANHPNMIYKLRDHLRNYVSQRISISFDEKSEEDKRAEALEYFVSGMIGAPQIEKKQLLQEDQLFGAVLRHQNKGIEGIPSLRWDLCNYIRENDKKYRPQLESFLMDELKAIKEFSTWEECVSTILWGYPQGSNLYENYFKLWKLREDTSFEEKAEHYIKSNGFVNYMSLMLSGAISPRRIEIQALADKEKMNISLYSHFCEEKKRDFKVDDAESTLSLLLDDQGLRRLVKN